jgi:fructosamine-3-kinase
VTEPPATLSDPPLEAAGLGGRAASVVPLAGGAVNAVWLVTTVDGSRLVLKTAPPSLEAADLFAVEAEGLDALRELGGLRTPAVLGAGPTWLLLEALDPVCPDGPAFWEEAGTAIARLHRVPGLRHGWHRDGWLGRLPQRNDWCEDGHEFFAVRRLLRYLPEPQVAAHLDAADRTALERLCARLRDLVPPMPPALTHGDLWRTNVVAASATQPVFIDPAVSFTWPEVDLSMLYCAGGPPVPPRFFDAYQEVRRLEHGWRDRMRVLHLRALLCDLAHFGDRWGCVADIRETLRPFRRRRPGVAIG